MAAEIIVMFLSQGSRAQLKQTLTSIIIIQSKLKHQHLISIWLVMSEAGDAVCGVVSSSSAEIFRDFMSSFILC